MGLTEVAPDRRVGQRDWAFLRAIAGMRALVAAFIAFAVLTDPNARGTRDLIWLLPYLIWACGLLWKTLEGWDYATFKSWIWIDASALLIASTLAVISLPLFSLALVLPILGLAFLLAESRDLSIGLVVAAVLLLLVGAWAVRNPVPPVPLMVPITLFVLGPAALVLIRHLRELSQRLTLVDTLNDASDPRHGLRHNVSLLLDRIASHFQASIATISLQGPEPRAFQWRGDGQLVQLTGPEADRVGALLAGLPRMQACLCSVAGEAKPRVKVVDLATGVSRVQGADHGWAAASEFAAYSLALPILTYGQPLGTLSLHRARREFTASDVSWLASVMRQAMPMLERSDLLEQLQRETATRERERIGRDLHDSAVQPYLGLKYGLEALARQAGPQNPISGHISELVQMATNELATLREVISGLRIGDDPGHSIGASIAALERQAQRFKALYGLDVKIVAAHALQLRGAAAKAVLHMVNEALTNVRRHTAATEVTVQLDVDDSGLVLRLGNNCPSGRSRDFVPLSLKQRAAEFGGTLVTLHKPGRTEIVITMPLLGSIA
ncbi:MAG: histidine kinase [Burkholderiaceae bacterium]